MAPKSSKGKGVISSSQVFASKTGRPINVGVVIRDVLRQARVKKGGVMEEQLWQLNINYPLSENSRALYRFRPKFEEPFDGDDATNDEKDRVDSDLESDGDDGKDSEMGKVAYAPTNDED
ncbi:hypothetical protein HAX54_037873 [Datura stramonium]|uniref:Uncharacterized protein n=1 Tax=Datura stramonium TaxID=4076 RepID=A0ABS8VK82_DATST|nr:hypothetical protein [Datura stramonium]